MSITKQNNIEEHTNKNIGLPSNKIDTTYFMATGLTIKRKN